jgi:hypothetical protein
MEKFFLTFDDPNAIENFDRARSFIPDLQQINTKMSIADSHKMCGSLSLTNQFMVLDADAYLLDDFKMSEIYEITKDKNFVYIFSARNPVNDLEYGHGGVKIFQRNFFNNADVVDFSTSFLGKIRPVKKTLNIHKFNASPFHAWRTAFRECVKLSSSTIINRNSFDDEVRLTTWCEKFNDVDYAEFVKIGAVQGRDFGNSNKNNLQELKKVNDFAWLRKAYEQVV